MKIKYIYDNGGETADRYTVYYAERGALTHTRKGTLRMCLSMSEAPTHPQGIGQHGYGMPGRHNGKRITFEELPKACQEVVMRDL
jgi:hypothetical protein